MFLCWLVKSVVIETSRLLIFSKTLHRFIVGIADFQVIYPHHCKKKQKRADNGEQATRIDANTIELSDSRFTFRMQIEKPVLLMFMLQSIGKSKPLTITAKTLSLTSWLKQRFHICKEDRMVQEAVAKELKSLERSQNQNQPFELLDRLHLESQVSRKMFILNVYSYANIRAINSSDFKSRRLKIQFSNEVRSDTMLSIYSLVTMRCCAFLERSRCWRAQEGVVR